MRVVPVLTLNTIEDPITVEPNIIKRNSIKFLLVRRVRNTEGPSDRMPSLKEELWAELILEGRDYPRPEIGSKNVLMLEERIQEMEEELDCKGRGVRLMQYLPVHIHCRVILKWYKSTAKD